ncbi:MAG: type II toxin-antitoxin system HicA family toxin [Magnetococcales bacterium]|nr:type II toxin-antitoxin system HicA family toxin [Magnetococcales bacterium]
MSKLSPIDWQTLSKVFEADGFQFVRQSGSHRIYVKHGSTRPLVIPAHDSVSVGVIKSNLKTAGMSRDRFFELLKMVKS